MDDEVINSIKEASQNLKDAVSHMQVDAQHNQTQKSASDFLHLVNNDLELAAKTNVIYQMKYAGFLEIFEEMGINE